MNGLELVAEMVALHRELGRCKCWFGKGVSVDELELMDWAAKNGCTVVVKDIGFVVEWER